jgi:hypothetical protein
MGNISQLSIREKYMQLSKKMLIAAEEGRPDEEIERLHRELKQLEPLLVEIEEKDAPDCP